MHWFFSHKLQKIELEAFHDDATNIEKYLEENTINLALIHFMMAYVEPEIIISKASKILTSGGLCSIATSTLGSFKNLQILANIGNLINKFYGFSKISTDDNVKIPKNEKKLESLLEKYGFAIIAQEICEEKVKFTDLYHVHNWGVNSGWLTQILAPITKVQLDKANFFLKYFFPLEDTFKSAIILAQKQ
ncbi:MULTISPECIES: hypothetical protein [Okeania]|uniref:Uncharacterized protein n=1 Tax=Okeania hirsuta TaxID=1458930 RepID=A0A3N6NA31_9CYAN|nr:MULTISPECIES: hypothetical protein [Okeania]NET12632.1 hypothetical protein [Okeania sp. SIO1H6]NES79499.1 hypothetical protein [Okeania sp. SIO1H4]NET23152.1 hypothetical protein [Okeania sp. SIO1H5]NET75877.1 hypothetical protein [Okeania sp. SIO1F9]NET96655.1 hypothetical protein [Okeania sp. SIO1H2]